jgi:hypothetical protein
MSFTLDSYLRFTEEHDRKHLFREEIQITDRSCEICYPVTTPISQSFNHFWTWTYNQFNARSYSAYTLTAFEAFIAKYYSEGTPIQTPIDKTLEDLALSIVVSTRYLYNFEVRTFIRDLLYIARYTNYFQRPVSNKVLKGNSHFHLTGNLKYTLPQLGAPSGTNITNTNINNTPMAMDANAFQTEMENIFGTAGAHLRTRHEKELVKIATFHERDDEDPIEWLEHILKAAEANRWSDQLNRRKDILAAFLKDAAATWFEGDRANIDNWNTNGSNTSFVSRFKLYFCNEAKKGLWYQQIMCLRQAPNESVDSYATKFLKLANRLGTGSLSNEQQKRMFMYGLSPIYAPMVHMKDPGTIAEAIQHARSAEVGYHYANPTLMMTTTPMATSSTSAIATSTPSL